MLTITQEIKRLERLLNGETVEGLKLNDPGLSYQWVIQRIANLRQIQREQRRADASSYFAPMGRYYRPFEN